MKSNPKTKARVEDDGERLVIRVRPKSIGLLPLLTLAIELSCFFMAHLCIFLIIILTLGSLYQVNVYEDRVLFIAGAVSIIAIVSSIGFIVHYFSRSQTIETTRDKLSILNRSLLYKKTMTWMGEELSFLGLFFINQSSPHNLSGPLRLFPVKGKARLFGPDLDFEEAIKIARAIKQRTGIADRAPDASDEKYFIPLRPLVRLIGKFKDKVEVADYGNEARITITQKGQPLDILSYSLGLLFGIGWVAFCAALFAETYPDYGPGIFIIVLGAPGVTLLYLGIYHISYALAGKETVKVSPDEISTRSDIFRLRGKTKSYSTSEITAFFTDGSQMVWIKISGKLKHVPENEFIGPEEFNVARLIKERAGISDDISWGV